jgi:molybdopterin-guanine dinucleotide biosynthesis protein A
VNLSAVILAGGESRRMGRDKAFLSILGQTLIERMIARAREAGAEEVFISGRAGRVYPDLGIPVLYDREPGLGPLAGIERALDATTTHFLLVLAVDLALMNRRVLDKMASHCDTLTGVLPWLENEGLQPLAAIYPRRCSEIARGLLARHRLAARDFAEACLLERAVKRWPVPPEAEHAFSNWNEPSDLPPSHETA